jgi:putative ABC transport system substrate-binding protein
MNRRQFIAFGSTVLMLGAAHAHAAVSSTKSRRVGIFLTAPLETPQRPYVKAFFSGMRELGWIEGSNLAYEHARYPLTDLYRPKDEAQMIEIARELIQRKPEVIWLLNNVSAKVLSSVNSTIPAVGALVSDVVENGLALSLARPGKNLTGISAFTWELGGRRFQLLHAMIPKLSRVGVLVHPKNRYCARELELIEEAARGTRVTVLPIVMEREDQAEGVFEELSRRRAEALLLPHVVLYQSSRKLLLALALQHKIPVVGHRPYFADDGGLLAYSTSLDEQMRRSAHLLDKILKGENAGEIPIEQPTRFELVVNRASARMYGLTIPHSLLVQADRIVG